MMTVCQDEHYAGCFSQQPVLLQPEQSLHPYSMIGVIEHEHDTCGEAFLSFTFGDITQYFFHEC